MDKEELQEGILQEITETNVELFAAGRNFDFSKRLYSETGSTHIRSTQK